MSDRPTYETVLVPTDGSETATTAVEHALGVAERYDATLHVVYVVDTVRAGVDGDAVMVQDTLEQHGRNVLENAGGMAEGAGVDAVETALLVGSPHREILDYAGENDVDLVVMGTHGRRGIERYLLGSVTEKVVRLADVPVLSVHGDPDESTAGNR